MVKARQEVEGTTETDAASADDRSAAELVEAVDASTPPDADNVSFQCMLLAFALCMLLACAQICPDFILLQPFVCLFGTITWGRH